MARPLKKIPSKEVLDSMLVINPLTGDIFKKCKDGEIRPTGSIDTQGHKQVNIGGSLFMAHRIIYFYHYGYCPDILDHIDRNKCNNSISNLRPATPTQNCQNSTLRKSSKSGVLGVTWYARYSKWRARITVNKRALLIGYFDSKEEAHKARVQAEVKYFGEFSPSQGVINGDF